MYAILHHEEIYMSFYPIPTKESSIDLKQRAFESLALLRSKNLWPEESSSSSECIGENRQDLSEPPRSQKKEVKQDKTDVPFYLFEQPRIEITSLEPDKKSQVLNPLELNIVPTKRKAPSGDQSVDFLNSHCSSINFLAKKNSTITNRQIPSFCDDYLKNRIGSEMSLKLEEGKTKSCEELKKKSKKIFIKDHDRDFQLFWMNNKSPYLTLHDIESKQGALLPGSPLYKKWNECLDLLVMHGIEKKITTIFTETLYKTLKVLTTLKPIGDCRSSFKGVPLNDVLDCITDIDYKCYNDKDNKIRELNEKIKKIIDKTFGDKKTKKRILENLIASKMPVQLNELKDSGKTLISKFQNITHFEHLWQEPVVHQSEKLPLTIDEISYDEMINYYISGDKVRPVSIKINDEIVFKKLPEGEMISMKEKDFLFIVLATMYAAFDFKLDEKSLIDQIATLEFREKCDSIKFTPETLICFRLLKLGPSWKRADHYWRLRAGNAENNPLKMDVFENVSLDFHCDKKTLSHSYVEQIKNLKLYNDKVKTDQIKAIIPVSWKAYFPDMNIKVPTWHFGLKPLEIGVYDDASLLTNVLVGDYMSNFKNTPVGENELMKEGITMESIGNKSHASASDAISREITSAKEGKAISRKTKSLIF